MDKYLTVDLFLNKWLQPEAGLAYGRAAAEAFNKVRSHAERWFVVSEKDYYTAEWGYLSPFAIEDIVGPARAEELKTGAEPTLREVETYRDWLDDLHRSHRAVKVFRLLDSEARPAWFFIVVDGFTPDDDPLYAEGPFFSSDELADSIADWAVSWPLWKVSYCAPDADDFYEIFESLFSTG